MLFIKIILFSILILGIICVTYSVADKTYTCPKQKVEYRYIPKNPLEQQDEYVSDIFKSMFADTSVWIGDINDLTARKREEVNKYYISQT